MEEPQPLVIGVDIGGTNTDAVLRQGSSILASAKVPTSDDGVGEAMRALFAGNNDFGRIRAVFLGTTALVNALLEGRGLDRVAVVRLCGPSSRSLPPFVDFPPSLRVVIAAGTWMASGGLRFDGSHEAELNPSELTERIAPRIVASKAQAVVVSCTFSPSNPAMEEEAANILRRVLPSTTRITLSSASGGRLGLLARENSAILHACLARVAQQTATRARRAIYKEAGIPKSALLYFTANDGSVVSFAQASKSPLRCVACGPTNSLRGAGYLVASHSSSNNNDEPLDNIVLDVGGTSTDAGCLVAGQAPRDSNSEAYIAGVRCNHRTTDVVSIALGGGSIVVSGDSIGPESVGAEITEKALCFGGSVCTATCIAVAMGADMTWSNRFEKNNRAQAPSCDFEVPPFAAAAWQTMQKRFVDLVEKTRSDNRPVGVIIVGGASGLVDAQHLSKALGGGCSVIRPHHGAVANACGAASAQAVGEVEAIVNLTDDQREAILTQLKGKAQSLAGPAARLLECNEVPLAYLPGRMTRVFVRAVAPLNLSSPRQQPSSDEENTETQSEEKNLSNSPQPGLRLADPPPVEPSPPNVKDGVWTISEYDASCLAVGCGILGCGGGGSTFHGRLQLINALRNGMSIRVVSMANVPPDTRICPCGFMGAPSVGLETIGGSDQVAAAVRQNLTHSSTMGPTLITFSEIGGSNGIIPLLVGGTMNVAVIDADLMGRAFPELQMTTPAIYGLRQTPMTASDSFGRCVTINASSSSNIDAANEGCWTERVLRPVCVEFGCSAGLADCPLTGDELRKVGILGSLSRARRIGDCVLRHAHPWNAINSMLQQEGGKCIFCGIVSDVQQETTAGFAKGSLDIVTEDKSSVLTIQFQNEFLIARKRDAASSSASTVLGCVPDIISLVDADTARPIATEEVRFGFRVWVLLLPVSALLRTKEALRVVGPQAFGLNEVYSKSTFYSGKEDQDNVSSIADM